MLDRPDFAANRPVPVTLIMFIVEAVASLVLVAVTASHLAQIPVLLVSIPWLGFTAALTVFCTVGAFTIMNTWQPRITATEAGLIYCLEPLAASCLALFLPGLFAQWAASPIPTKR